MFLSSMIYSASNHIRRLARLSMNPRRNASVGPLRPHDHVEMESNVLQIDRNGSDHLIEKVTQTLTNGGIIAIPTDTLYGIAGIAANSEAIDKVYKIKKRNVKSAVAICVADIEDIQIWGQVSEAHIPILKSLLPGPVTILLQRTASLPPFLNPGNPLIGIRIPDHQFIRNVVRSIGSPLALTSANLSGGQSTIAIEEFQDLWPKLDLVLDEGQLHELTDSSRLGSTVVDLSKEGQFAITRRGMNADKVTSLLKNEYNIQQHLSS